MDVAIDIAGLGTRLYQTIKGTEVLPAAYVLMRKASVLR